MTMEVIWRNRQEVMCMTYTKDTLVIDNPSEELLKVVKKLRQNKLAQLEKLRKMKPEEFSCRILL